MFNRQELYEYLMEYDPTPNEDAIWQALATKFYIETENTQSNKLFDIIQKSKQYNINVPDHEMADGWRFIKEHVEGKITTPEELEKLVTKHGYTTITSSSSSISV